MSTEQPQRLDRFGYRYNARGLTIEGLQKLEDAAIWALEHVLIVLEEGQTQLRFQHVDRRESSLYLVNPQMHRRSWKSCFRIEQSCRRACRRGWILSTRQRGTMP